MGNQLKLIGFLLCIILAISTMFLAHSLLYYPSHITNIVSKRYFADEIRLTVEQLGSRYINQGQITVKDDYSNSNATFQIQSHEEPYRAVIVQHTGSIQHGIDKFTEVALYEYLKCLTNSLPTNIRSKSDRVRVARAYSDTFSEYMDIISDNVDIVTIILRWNIEGSLNKENISIMNFAKLIPKSYDPAVCTFINTTRYHSDTDECLKHTVYADNTTLPVTAHFFEFGSFKKEAALYFHVLLNTLIDDNGILQTENVTIVPFCCEGNTLKFTKSNFGYVKQTIVFVISQYWGSGFFHVNIEDIPRIMPHLSFLRERPDILIHIGVINAHTKAVFALLDINPSRLVSGPIQADIALSPQGGGCGGPMPLNIILLATEYQKAVDNNIIAIGSNKMKYVMPTKHNNAIILLKRNFKRGLKQHTQVEQFMRSLTKIHNIELIIFSDDALPNFTETSHIFRKTCLIVAPHGAGLSNILFMDPGSVVIEVLCKSQTINLCYASLSGILGLQYHGVLATSGCEAGMTVDLEYLFQVIEYFVRAR